MKSIFFRYLRLAVVVQAAFAAMAGGKVSAQHADVKTPTSTLQIRNPSFPMPGATRGRTTAKKPMTPFERVIAPHLAEFMKQDAAGKSGRIAAQHPRSRSETTAADGTPINFPGFLGVPFLTLDDGDSAPAYNTLSGNFNKDGHLDIAVVRTDGAIDVLLNPGSFWNIDTLTPIISNDNGNPNSLVIAWVVAADMNGDGFTDLVGQDVENSQIVIWIGKGDGSFAAPKLYPVTLPPGVTWSPGLSFGAEMLVGDFNGDGTLDIATLSYNAIYKPGASTTTITEQTFLNNGQGTLIPLAIENSTFNDYYFTSLYANASVTTVDGVAASGIAFLLDDAGITSPANAGLTIATIASNGDGTFKPAVEPPSALVQDYLLSVYGSFLSTNLSANIKGSSKSKATPAGAPGSGIPTADIVFITGDGAVYDAPFSSGNPTVAKVLVGQDSQGFAFGLPPAPPATPPPSLPSLIATPIPNEQTINIADMDGDGLVDLVVYGVDSSYIFPNAGKGVFTSAPVQMVGSTPGLQEPQPEDYDSSGYHSFITVDSELGEIGYYRNLGATASAATGQFQAAPLITGTNTAANYETLGGNIEIIATADVNGDGLPDLIGMDFSKLNANAGSAEIVVGIRNATGAANQTNNYSFTTAVDSEEITNVGFGLVFMEPFAISNAAGTSILLVTYQGGLSMVTIGKDGKGGPLTAVDLGGHQDCLVSYGDVGDVNGDGILDIVIAYSGDAYCSGTDGVPSGFYTMLGNANGSFQKGTFTPLGSALYQIRLINFSGVAGNLDLAANDQNIAGLTSAIYVLPNKADGTGAFDTTRGSRPVSNYVVSDIIAGDYNSDGKQDLTLTTVGEFNPNTGTIYPNTAGVLLLPGTGNFTFGTPVLTDPGNYPLWGSYADFNGDGLLDLALVETYDIYNTQAFTPAVQVLPNLGAGTFGPPIIEMNSFTPTKDSFTGYTLTGRFANSGGNDLLVSSNYSTAEFVNQGVTTLALTASPNAVAQGSAVTLTASIAQTVGTSAISGSVSFYSNAALLGASAVANGSATLTTTTLPPGNDTVTATYSGDGTHNQSSASMNIAVTVASPTFVVSASPATLSLVQGATGSVTLALAANGTFSGVIAVTCSGMPAESSCTVTPSSLTLGANQTGNVAVIVATTLRNNQYDASNHSPRSTRWAKAAGSISVAGILLLIVPRRRRIYARGNAYLLAVLAISLLGSVALLSGCGSGSSDKFPGTPTGTTTVTVQATSGAITQTQTITLTVTASQP